MAEEQVKDSATQQRTFSSRGPRDRVPPTSTRDEKVTAHDKSSTGGRRAQPQRVIEFTRAPARDKRAARARAEKVAEKAAQETAEAPAQETAEVAPEETQAVTMKPEARKVASRKKSS